MTNLPTEIQEVLPKEHVTWRLRYDTGWHTLLRNHWRCFQPFHSQGGSSLAHHLVFSVPCELFLFYSLISYGHGPQCLLHSQVLSLAPLLPGLTPVSQGQRSAGCTSPDTRSVSVDQVQPQHQTSHLESATAGPCGGA